MNDGRRHAPELVAILRAAGDRHALAAPRPGWLRGAAAPGSMLREGMVLGELEVLGSRHRLLVPAGASGIVLGEPWREARRALAYGETMMVLDPSAIAASAVGGGAASARAASGALVFRAPMSGRYYARPAPGADPWVRAGDEIETGRTIAILEVMKTFHRVHYAGTMFPERAKVIAIVPADGDDVNAGDPLLELEPA